MKRFQNLWPAALIVVGGLAVFLWQGQTTRRLQREMAARRVAGPDVRHLRAENALLRGALAAPEGAQAKQRTQTEIARLRLEIAFWEEVRKASKNNIPLPAIRPVKAAKTDLIRIEDFQNAGQASPGAAFQTFVWAIARDDVSALKPLLYLSPAGRQKLQEFWSGLPAEVQARFKEPEQILLLLWAQMVLNEDGFKIVGETPQPSGDVLLCFKTTHGERKIPFRASPGGWQLVMPDEAMGGLSQAVAEASLQVPPPAKP